MQRADSSDDFFIRRHVGATRVRDTYCGENRTAPALRAVLKDRWRRTVHRDAQTQSEITLDLARGEEDEVSTIDIGNMTQYACQRVRAVEQFLRQRPLRRIRQRQHGQAGTSVVATSLWDQGEVVIDNAPRHRLRRHVDHVRARLAQEK